MDIAQAIRMVEQLATELKDMNLTLTPRIGTGCHECSRVDPYQFCIELRGWPHIPKYEGMYPDAGGQSAWVDMIPTNENYDAYWHIFFAKIDLPRWAWTTNKWHPAEHRATIRANLLQALDKHLEESQQLFRVEITGGIETGTQHLLQTWTLIAEEVFDNHPSTAAPIGVIMAWHPFLTAVNKNGSVDLEFTRGELGYLVPRDALHRIVAAS